MDHNQIYQAAILAGFKKGSTERFLSDESKARLLSMALADGKGMSLKEIVSRAIDWSDIARSAAYWSDDADKYYANMDLFARMADTTYPHIETHGRAIADFDKLKHDLADEVDSIIAALPAEIFEKGELIATGDLCYGGIS